MNSTRSREIYTNKLIRERSPYLLQHAHNPVNWYPWGEEAFEKARNEDKLIFLSIGYSTCHWCHVMERESFRNPQITEIMNNNYVNIKVDREERPDIDQMYMTYVSLCSESAGWPLSVFLTPNLTPIFGGTYFPATDCGSIDGFATVLLSLLRTWTENKQSVIANSDRVTKLIVKAKSSFVVNKDLRSLPDVGNTFNLCAAQLLHRYDSVYGGFSTEPKFPQAAVLNFLFYYYKSKCTVQKYKDEALLVATHTLNMMANGGIYDHLGQGFARYSTDKKWHVPHFEKMLYDQAQISVAYSNAFRVTGNEKYKNMMIDILSYTLRDLKHPKGVFYSAEDADSYPFRDSQTKKEGAFYVWTYGEITNILSMPLTCREDIKLADVFKHHYNVQKNGNTKHSSERSHDLEGKNVLFIDDSEENTSKKFGITVEELRKELVLAKELLLKERNKRPRPFLDSKIIVSWNGLMLSALSKAAQTVHLDDPNLYNFYKSTALKLAQSIERYFWVNERILLHCGYTSGMYVVQSNQPIEGFLNDYAFVIAGLIDIYEISFEAKWMKWALKLQKIQNELFWNNEKCLFDVSATNPNDSATTVIPLKNFVYEDYDGPEPSGNSVSLSNLIRLGTVFQIEEFHKMAGELLQSYYMTLMEPYRLPSMVSCLANYENSLTTLIIRGQLEDKRLEEMVEIIHSKYIVDGLLLYSNMINNDGDGDYFNNVPLEDVVTKEIDHNENPSINICSKHSCLATVNSKEELVKFLYEFQV